MDLSIIIVTWNSRHYLKKCLDSIFSETKNLDFEIIMVDNNSVDGTEEFIKKEYSKIKFIQSGENLGFAKANNLGFQNSSGRILLFLNPDTEVIETAINNMFRFLDSRSDAGAVGCKLLNSDKSIQTSCIQRFPTIVNQILDIELLKMFFPKLRVWGIAPLFSTNVSHEHVEVISGACVMVKRHVFEDEDIDKFSEEYFMYSEDVDLCYKIKKKGYGIFYSGDAAIIHHGGGSSKQHPVKDFNIVLMRESRYKFLKKSKGELYARLYKVSMILTSIMRLSILAIIIVLNPIIRTKGNFHYPLRKWKKIFSWSVGNEKWLDNL